MSEIQNSDWSFIEALKGESDKKFKDWEAEYSASGERMSEEARLCELKWERHQEQMARLRSAAAASFTDAEQRIKSAQQHLSNLIKE